MNDPLTDANVQLERYAELLQEARAVKGLSLGRDAWRRLRKSRVAMISLWGLVLLSVLAFLTPMLPLQPPRKVHTERIYASPVFYPLFVESFHLDEPLRRADQRVRKAREELRKAQQDQDHRQVEQIQVRIATIIRGPYREGFGELNWLNRGLVRLRLIIFKRWTITSVCGTDNLGRDLLARLFWGARISLVVGLVAALVSLVIGVSYGATSGYLGGHVDNIMMRIVDVLYSIPFIFVVIFLITVLSQEQIKARLESWHIDRITIFFFVVGAIYWLTMARVVRGQVISLKQEQFVEAARTIGARRTRIIFGHLVPNLLSVIIVYLTLTIPRVMLFEAFLSFLGLGVEPPDVSWGLLANEGVRVITPVKIYWWLIVFPGAALGVTLFALNFLGDGLRDALDPRMKNR